jgi:hypothetical protein
MLLGVAANAMESATARQWGNLLLAPMRLVTSRPLQPIQNRSDLTRRGSGDVNIVTCFFPYAAAALSAMMRYNRE